MKPIKYIRQSQKIIFNVDPKFYRKVVYYKNGIDTLFITSIKICGSVTIKDDIFDKFKNNLYIDNFKLTFES